MAKPKGQPVIEMTIVGYYHLFARELPVDFLERHPQVRSVLLELASIIPKHFPGAPLHLRVVDTAPTRDAPDGRRLVLFIATDCCFEEAMDRMDQVMAAWSPDVRATSSGPFSVDLAFGTTSDDIDAVAQQFSQTHGALPRTQGDLVRRLLQAQPGSFERSLARAELASAIADERGEPAISRGVDVYSVLVHLRQQADAQP